MFWCLETLLACLIRIPGTNSSTFVGFTHNSLVSNKFNEHLRLHMIHSTSFHWIDTFTHKMFHKLSCIRRDGEPQNLRSSPIVLTVILGILNGQRSRVQKNNRAPPTIPLCQIFINFRIQSRSCYCAGNEIENTKLLTIIAIRSSLLSGVP